MDEKLFDDPMTCRSCGGSGKRHPDNNGTAFNCHDCGKPSGGYMVHNRIWNLAWPDYVEKKRELMRKYKGTPEHFRAHLSLCLGCLEKRLGRELEDTDFDPSLPINEGLVFGVQLGLRMAARRIFPSRYR